MQRTSIKLKNPASKASSNQDKDYDPTVPEIHIEEPQVNKRKGSSIKLVNPKRRKTDSPEIDTKLAIAKAKEIEETLGELNSIESELAFLDKQITKLPAVKLKVFNQTTKSPSSATKRTRNRTRKNYDDDEIDEDDELIDEDDDDPYYRKKENRLVDQGNNFEESSLTDDEGDFDFSYGAGVATNRSKRPPKPSQRYPDHVKSRNKQQRRERAEQRERERALQQQQESVIVNDVIMTPSPATSAPTPSRLRGKNKKSVLDVPYWKPIKAKPNTSSPEAMAQCRRVLQEIQKRPESPSFLEPVNAPLLGLHDYHKVIKQPMDLSTVQKQMREKKITSVEQFCQKMRLIWDNAVLYNGNDHEVGKLAINLSAYFENRMKPIIAQENPQEVDASELKHKISVYTREYKSLQNDLASLNASIQEPASVTEINPTDPNIDLSPQIGYISEAESKKTFEHAEKCQLYNAINGLQNCFLRGLYQIVVESNDKHCMKTLPDSIEVDTDTAPPLLLTRLQVYIKECQSILNKDKKGPSVDKTPGKTAQPQKEKSVESEKSSSTSETDSDSDDSSEGDPRLKTVAFPGIFDEKKQAQKQPQQPQPQKQTIQSPQQYHQQQPPHQVVMQQLPTDATSKLILPTSPLAEERNVVLQNSESWSQLNSFETPKENSADKTPGWENLKNRKTQLEQLEKEKEEQELFKNQQIKMKAEEETKRVNEEMMEMRRQAELESKQKKDKEDQERAQNIARMRELEREKREKELSSGVLKQPVNMFDQFEIMKSFQANYMPPK